MHRVADGVDDAARSSPRYAFAAGHGSANATRPPWVDRRGRRRRREAAVIGRGVYVVSIKRTAVLSMGTELALSLGTLLEH